MTGFLESAMTNILGAIGGIGVIVIGVLKLFGKTASDLIKGSQKARLDRRTETHRQNLENSRVAADRYAALQFETYRSIWKELQALNRKGDALWKAVTEETTEDFAEQLRRTKRLVEDEAILFEDGEYQEVSRVLEAFANYRLGKLRIIEIRDNATSPELDRHRKDFREQIRSNRNHKEDYENILANLRSSFRGRLSRVEA